MYIASIQSLRKEKNLLVVAKKYQNPSGGLNAAGRRYFKRKEGANLKAPVSVKKAKASKKAAKRRKSYCGRSKGQQTKNKIDCKKTPNKRICLARKKWEC